MKSTAEIRFFLSLAVLLAAATLVDSRSIGPLLARQVATAGNNTDGNSSKNGGAGSAEQSAQDAGNSISTGTGGSRSTPSSTEEFAQLLSGIFFGSLLTLFCGGALAVQIWHYYERFGRKGSDRRAIQAIVATLLSFSLLQDIVLIHRIYEIHVHHFGDFAFPLLTVGWEVACSFVCIGFMNGLVQLYYAHRVWVAFHQSKFVFSIYLVLISFTFAGGIASAALIIESGSAANVKGEALRSFLPDSIPWQFSVVFASWLCANAIIDVSLCSCLIYQLTKMTTPFFHTRHAVARLLLLSLETCVATSALSLICMILFLSIPYQSFYNILFLPIGQVAASSFLVTLMARPSIARELAQDQTANPLTGGLEAASSSAPRTLARPVIKKLMKKEERKRAQFDGTGVHLTTTIQQEHDSISEIDVERGNSNTKEDWVMNSAPTLHGDDDEKRERSKSDSEGSDNSHPPPAPPPVRKEGGRFVSQDSQTLPHPFNYKPQTTTAPLSTNRYVGSILTNGQDCDPARYAAQTSRDKASSRAMSKDRVVRIEPVEDVRACPWTKPA